MHGHDGADARVARERGGRLVEVDGTRVVDVAPDGLGAGAQDRERRRERRQRRGEHALAGLHARAAQRDLKRVEAAGDPDRVRDAPPRGELALEAANLLAEDEPAAATDALDRGKHIGADVLPLSREVVGGRATASLRLPRRQRYTLKLEAGDGSRGHRPVQSRLGSAKWSR